MQNGWNTMGFMNTQLNAKEISVIGTGKTTATRRQAYTYTVYIYI